MRIVLNIRRTAWSYAVLPGDLAMRLPARATITWLLAGLLALVSGVGEGLHMIPGCGHAVELPGGVLLLGVGEGVDDLSDFTARDFARAIVGLD